MDGMKERMIEAEERGWATPETSYDVVRDAMADSSDVRDPDWTKRLSEDLVDEAVAALMAAVATLTAEVDKLEREIKALLGED